MEDLWRRPGQHALRAARADQRVQLQSTGGRWRFKTDSLGPRREFQYESTPLYVHGLSPAPAQTPLNVQGLPLLKPPYGRITAIDLDKGEIRRQIAHGETPDNIRNHPAMKGLDIPPTRRPARGAMLRAYDKATGAEVGAVYMPAPQSGSPMTYMLDGEQYLVVAISRARYSGELLGFKLPGAQ